MWARQCLADDPAVARKRTSLSASPRADLHRRQAGQYQRCAQGAESRPRRHFHCPPPRPHPSGARGRPCPARTSTLAARPLSRAAATPHPACPECSCAVAPSSPVLTRCRQSAPRSRIRRGSPKPRLALPSPAGSTETAGARQSALAWPRPSARPAPSARAGFPASRSPRAPT